MPRIARLDTPGLLHYIMIWGMERRKILNGDKDHEDSAICGEVRRLRASHPFSGVPGIPSATKKVNSSTHCSGGRRKRMANQPNKQSCYVKLALVTILALVSSGCAIGVTRVKVAHDPLAVVESKKEGDILVSVHP